MKPTLHRIPLLPAFAALCLSLPAAAATVVSDFTQGAGGDSASHQFAGTAGEGWKDAWTTYTTRTTLTTVIDDDTHWLNVSVKATTGGSVRRSTLVRAYDSGAAATIDTTQSYSLSFSLRFDSLTNFDSADDYFGFFDNPAAVIDSVTGNANTSWVLTIQGDTKEIMWGNGDRAGNVTYASSGLTIQTGTVYFFVIDIDPVSRAYTVSITPEDGESIVSTALGFRSSATTLGDTGRYFHIETKESGSNDSWAYSFSGVTISQVPEPAAFAALLGGITLLGVCLRRRAAP